MQKQTDRHIEALTSRLKITGAHAHSREGEPANVITALCHSLDAQVLVVGTAQNTGPKMILLSRYFSRHAVMFWWLPPNPSPNWNPSPRFRLEPQQTGAKSPQYRATP
ncbi:MAG: hypothetical protein HQ497_00835 [SAR86 cluster bacterium]|uniref:Uncharacterized protein n=1 Tax=SAR86 cluster bacterium TaxID=2030880 RepID=A0A972VVI4_9GAMM|nr:hypothetical protein [SAR86 cluster bacterium]